MKTLKVLVSDELHASIHERAKRQKQSVSTVAMVALRAGFPETEGEYRLETFSVPTGMFSYVTGVRVTHNLSGLSAECSLHRGAHQNRAEAFTALREKLLAAGILRSIYADLS